MKVSGGRAVVDILVKEGVKKAFCVPGESYLGVLDALYEHPQIELISARHEGGASFMAEGYAKASGEVGVCMATRGVGAANLAIGIHTASQDSTPLVALIGQVERPFKEKEAFQEVDLVGFFRHLCKWTVEIDRVERIPELLHRAFHMARSGRPGPVVVALPHDMLEDEAEMVELPVYRSLPPQPHIEEVKQAVEMIQKAEQPVLIAGGGVIHARATPLLVEFAEAMSIPVVTAFRRYDAFPNLHSCYAGWLGFGTPAYLLEAIRDADLVVALGTRFSQVGTQDYTLLSEKTRLIHIDISPDVFGKVYAPSLAVTADTRAFLQQALQVAVPSDPARQERTKALHAKYIEFSEVKADYTEDWVDMDGLLHDVVSHLPKDSIITNDAGNFFGWLSRYYRFEKPNTYVGPTSGAMGYGLPAAIGAKLAKPDKTVVSFSGDGGFMMTVQEIETAVRYQVPVISIVVNNNRYGTIRMHQEMHFPNRVVGTNLSNPDFAELARLFGAHGEKVKKNSDFVPALQRSIASGLPAVIEVVTNPEILSVSQDKTKARRNMVCNQ
ncbi:thiamine pyrophosphate-dependent enzyme [Aneurinibacillus sp. UBA3580]|jgi:acetolactate synthase-1/2/3 large subunit|uniref:thiamine pyrophosphate-dependent enzyme n=1 Tax=Aneurinibacillus sp. UBA3580 TaxID=1946041 RepID=UPI00257F7787|nr:thiamine pyrophosphate-dependent enzyme [Aneurinibacillus sp. UBA3580]